MPRAVRGPLILRRGRWKNGELRLRAIHLMQRMTIDYSFFHKETKLISNRISSYFQRLDPPHWTAYLEECLQKLIEDEECETDRLLACLLQFQLITDKAAQAPWHDRTLEPLTSRAPATFYLKALETQLQDFKSTIPTELQQNGKPLPFLSLLARTS